MSLYSVRFKPFLRAVVLFLLINICIITLYAKRVEPSVAQTVASTFLRNNGAKSDQLTDVSVNVGFSNFYIFNGENEFVIVAADDRVKPILGYSLTEKFVIENMPENLRFWLQGYNDEIQYAIDNQISVSKDASHEWDALKNGNINVVRATVVVNPLIETTWGQLSPYNDLCPSGCPTGCVATAMAQIMKKWNKPAQGYGSNSYSWNNTTLSADFGNTTYDWANMTNTYNSSSSDIEKAAVATLMYHCGVSVNMQYGNTVSSTLDILASYAFKDYFRYSSDTHLIRRNSIGNDEVWISIMKGELDSGRPIFYGGDNNQTGNDYEGHAFVCDGYNSNDFFHFNWGWNGDFQNMYFSIDIMNPDNSNYSYNQDMIYGIQPSDIGCSVPTHLGGNVNGNSITLFWDDAGADSYSIYRNGVLIESSAVGTSFTDSNMESGVYDYYLRSNCSDGTTSAPSNIMEAVIENAGVECSAPTNLSASISGRTVTLSWTAAEGVSSYRIYRNDELITTNATGTIYIDGGLQIGEYEYYLRSNCSDENISYPSNVVNVEIETGDCSAPTNLSATLNDRNVSLSWTAAEGVSSYRIYRNNELIESNATGTSYTDSSLGVGQYNYYLRSNCEDGSLSDISNVASVNMPFHGDINVTIGDLIYSLDLVTNEAEVMCYYNGIGATGSLVLPSTVTYQTNSYVVTAIAPHAFSGCSDFTGSLAIPNSVITIGNSAFEGCCGFNGSLTIPNSVTTIGKYAFYYCSGFTGSLMIPNSVTDIGDYAFCSCSGFTGSLTIPNSVITIGKSAFSYCSGFTGSLMIPNSVTDIGEYAFCACSFNGLNIDMVAIPDYFAQSFTCTGSLIIGNSVTSIGEGAFSYCSGFTGSLTIGNSLAAIGEEAFYYCSGFTGSLAIPNSVTDIGDYAFYNCSGFTGSLAIGNSVTDIGDNAFYGCSGFTGSLTIGNSVTYIGDYAFCGCSGFTGSLTIPNSVTTIGYTVFIGCSFNGLNIDMVAIPDNFSSYVTCTGSLTIGNSVTTIGNSAFYGCSGFTGSLTIPNSVTSIGEDAFYGCRGFTGSLTIGNSVVTIGYRGFDGCSFNGLNIDMVAIPDNFSSYVTCTGSLTIGNSVTTIGNSAFYGCSGFTGSLTIPNSVTSIGEDAFYGCRGFTGSLTIPNSVTSIGEGAFSYCSGFTGSLTIPNSVTSIGEDAFYGCSGFTGSLAIPNSVTDIGDCAFCGCRGFTGSLTIPNSVTDIGDYAFYNCSGFTGSLAIPNSVTDIGDYAFYNCSGFTGSLAIGNSITTIENSVFEGCSGFTGSLTIGNSVTDIGDYAFYGCRGFTGSLMVPNSVTDIGDYAFYGCSGLTEVHYSGNIAGWCNISFSDYTSNPLYYAHNLYINDELITDLSIPETVSNIKQYVFTGYRALTSVTMPTSVTNIGDNAFYNCSGLTSLTIPNSVTTIGSGAFANCTGLEAVYYQGDVETWCNIDFAYDDSNPLLYANNLYIDNELVTDIVIPETVTALKKYVFIGYSSLATVTISNSVTSIGNSAFDGCSNLTSVTIASSVASIGNYAFDGCGSLNAIRVQWSNPITINHNSFCGIDRSVPVYVPCGSQDDYKAAQYWSEFENINESQHNLALINNDKDGGDITVLKWADCEDNHCAILATPNIGYDFVGWYVNDELSTLEPFCDFSLTEDITFEGRFERTASHYIANGTSNVWSNSDTWDLGVVPTSISTVGIRKSIKVDVDATVSSLGIYDNSVLTVLSGVTLTITDTLGSTKASSIIIEDGGQLIHSSNGAMATIKQSIEPYTSDEDGWNLISYPMTGNGSISSVNNMLSNLYDLYYYDEPNERWVNSKDDNNSFTDLEAGKGYLYANIGMGVGAAAGSTIGDGSLTTGYTPFNTYYKYSISEILFRVSELESAGLATAEMGALCWYATNETGYQQNNISIWMANVEDDELTSTSHNVAGMTLVYTGSMKPIIGWNEFVFNENNFTWDGTSNILICVQRNNGAWNGAINWQSHNPGFNAVSYKYTDNNAYDMTSETYSMTVSTTRPNTVFQTIEQIGHYASYEPITMSYAGQLANGAAEVAIPLSYTGGHRLSGFNLVGNPFVHNVTSYATTDVADGCFRVNDAKTNLIVSSVSEENPLKPAEGFFVKATGDNASVTFNSQTRDTNEDKGSIQLEIVQNDKLIDRFIVKEGVKLNKISLSGEHIELYAKTNNQKYAIVPFNGQEQAVNFKTFKMGTFTINVKVENMDLPYLHLVDNFTGQDIDLLITPSYTFNATSIDNESRFRLVFDQKFAVNNNDVFAYQYGDEIIVNGKGTLQVFDVLGRIVANYQINGMESISNPSQKGVYVLRLLGDNLKTQKIVVK